MSRPNDDRDGLRRCRDCDRWKPLEEFHFNPQRPTGRGSYCKPCFNKRAKTSYAKRVKAKHGREARQPREVPEGHRYCPDCQTIKPLAEFPVTAQRVAVTAVTASRVTTSWAGRIVSRTTAVQREYHLRRRYGIGQKEFDELLAEQGGVCAICGAESPEHVDDDHETGYIRGSLCFNCNGGLGQFRDSSDYLAKAIDYVRDTRCGVLIHPGVYRVLLPRRGRLPSLSS